ALPGILPPLSREEALEVTRIFSAIGQVPKGQSLITQRPVRTPHHTASPAAIIGGGTIPRPGEVSLAHHGVLFLDEFPEFPRTVLETLRQPIETGDVVVARANAHVKYPCKFMLVAAANPCRCGYMSDPARACARVPMCGEDYLGRISGPLMDRFDIRIEVPPVKITDLAQAPAGEPSEAIAQRIAAARQIQSERYKGHPDTRVNADIEGEVLEATCTTRPDAADLLHRAADRYSLSARAYHRILRVARTIADLAGEDQIAKPHIAEALGYRLSGEEQKTPAGQARPKPRAAATP
ncbi:MAG: ATP-binding protein, partial [Pseudomonadota bacterium]